MRGSLSRVVPLVSDAHLPVSKFVCACTGRQRWASHVSSSHPNRRRPLLYHGADHVVPCTPCPALQTSRTTSVIAVWRSATRCATGRPGCAQSTRLWGRLSRRGLQQPKGARPLPKPQPLGQQMRGRASKHWDFKLRAPWCCPVNHSEERCHFSPPDLRLECWRRAAAASSARRPLRQ